MARKRKPEYKQMAFETAVRNPERYKGILSVVKDYDGRKLDDDCLLEIVSKLYLEGEVSSTRIEILEDTKLEDITNLVKEVNSTRNADGGFPKGYQSRFWTYMRTMSELGIVLARYNKVFKISELAKKLLNEEIDEQELFSIQAMKYNRKSPYRNVSNDFNYFRFILEVLMVLREKKKKLSHEQFIVSLFSKNGNVRKYLNLIEENKFNSLDETYRFLKEKYGVTNRFQTVTKDYPDVVLRLLRITGFITLDYKGKIFIRINEKKLNYIQRILKVEFNLSKEEKENPLMFFYKLNLNSKEYLQIIHEYRYEDKIIVDEYNEQLKNIIKTYNINLEKLTEYINKIGSRRQPPEFKFIPDPLKLEFYISLLIYIKYKDKFKVKPNYKSDELGIPISHAPGNTGDIEVLSLDIYWLIEVTLIRNKTQQYNNETTSVIRHFNKNEYNDKSKKYLSFIAPYIHEDTNEFYKISIIKLAMNNKKNLYIKPYSIEDFTNITVKENNLSDMEDYTLGIYNKLKDTLS